MQGANYSFIRTPNPQSFGTILTFQLFITARPHLRKRPVRFKMEKITALTKNILSKYSVLVWMTARKMSTLTN